MYILNIYTLISIDILKNLKDPMLKKLVKYGNSNALVFDKAILELLNIKEGSIVKISTDGRTLTITPQDSESKNTVSPTVNFNDTFSQATLKNMFKIINDLSEEEQEELAEQYQKYYNQLQQNEQYIAKVIELQSQYKQDLASEEYFQKIINLKAYFAPELLVIENKLRQYNKNPEKALSPEEAKEMSATMAKVQKKYAHVIDEVIKVSQEENYLHDAQVLSEKYVHDKDTKAYLEAVNALKYKYVPELKLMEDEMQLLTQKYFPKK